LTRFTVTLTIIKAVIINLLKTKGMQLMRQGIRYLFALTALAAFTACGGGADQSGGPIQQQTLNSSAGTSAAVLILSR
jgi:hypothetical protein